MARGSIALDQIKATFGTYTEGNIVVFDANGTPIDGGSVLITGSTPPATPILDSDGNPIFDSNGNWIFEG
jgi:hypothetical protein